jgi:hypothetical protein
MFLGALTAGCAVGGIPGAAIASLACLVLKQASKVYQERMSSRYSISDRYDALRQDQGADLSFDQQILEIQALQGDPNARAKLGRSLVDGYLIDGKIYKKNPELALTYFTQAANHAKTDVALKKVSCLNAALCHYFGIGTAKDVTKAQEFFRRFPLLEMVTSMQDSYALHPKVTSNQQRTFFLALVRNEDEQALQSSLASFQPI